MDRNSEQNWTGRKCRKLDKTKETGRHLQFRQQRCLEDEPSTVRRKLHSVYPQRQRNINKNLTLKDGHHMTR